MKDFFSNPWVKRSVAVFNLAYFAVICMFTFATFLYQIQFTDGKEVTFFVVYFIASLLFMGLMIYARREILTRIVSVAMPPVCFCLILFNWGNWILIIPPFIVALVMFFASGVHETTKVILGTIYLLMYVLGLVAFLVLRMLFGGSSVTTLLNSDLQNKPDVYELYKGEQFAKLIEVTKEENLISPDGKYRIVLYDVQDNDKGRIKICVVPHGQDIELNFFTLKQKGIEKTISNKGPRGTIPEVGWEKDPKTGAFRVYYVLSKGAQRRYSTVNDNNMPDKQYLEFLGIS